MTDDRGTSVTLGYVLALGITVLLVSGLMVAAAGFVEAQQRSTVRSELRVAGEQLAADVTQADRLANTTNGGRVWVRSPLPDRVAGAGYTVNVTHVSGRQYVLTLQATSPSVTVTVGFTSSTPVATETVRGGDVRVRYRSGPDELALEANHA